MAATAVQAFAVTPSNAAADNFSSPVDALYIGTSGDVSVVTKDGGTAVYKAVAVGHLMQACARVNATGTTAADILGLYIEDI